MYLWYFRDDYYTREFDLLFTTSNFIEIIYSTIIEWKEK